MSRDERVSSANLLVLQEQRIASRLGAGLRHSLFLCDTGFWWTQWLCLNWRFSTRLWRVCRLVKCFCWISPTILLQQEKQNHKHKHPFMSWGDGRRKSMGWVITYCEILSCESPGSTECWHKQITGKTLKQLEWTLRDKAFFKRRSSALTCAGWLGLFENYQPAPFISIVF